MAFLPSQIWSKISIPENAQIPTFGKTKKATFSKVCAEFTSYLAWDTKQKLD